MLNFLACILLINGEPPECPDGSACYTDNNCYPSSGGLKFVGVLISRITARTKKMVNKIANILVCTNGHCPADETCSNGNCVEVGSSITDSKTNTSVATSGSAHRK